MTVTEIQRKPRRRRWLKVLAILFLLLVIVVALLPTALSTGFVRSRVETQLSEQLNTKVTLTDHSLSWWSGVHLRGLTIANPSGFPIGKAVEIGEISSQVSWSKLLTGRVDLRGTATDVEVLVYRRGDGKLNLQALQPESKAQSGAPTQQSESAPPETESDLDRVALDFHVEDARVRVVDEKVGELERIDPLVIDVRKEFDSTDVVLAMVATMPRANGEPAHIELAADVSAALDRPATARLDIQNLDLNAIYPIVAAFSTAEQPPLSELAGVAAGQIEGSFDVEQRHLVLGGAMTVEQPRLRGPALGTATVSAPRWTIQPDLEVRLPPDGGPPTVTATDFLVDLGIIKVTGIANADAAALHNGATAVGANVRADLGALRQLGIELPAELSTGQGIAEGIVAIAIEEDLFDPEKLTTRAAELVAMQFDVQATGFGFAGYVLDNLVANASLNGGEGKVMATANLAGGPLELEVDVATKDAWPTKLRVQWQGGQLDGAAATVLRYAVPFLAGIDPEAGIGAFQSKIDLDLSIQGPGLRGDAQTLLGWLNHWNGTGELGLREGSLSLAPALQPLLQLGAKRQDVPIEDLLTQFAIQDGFLQTGLLQLDRHNNGLKLEGRTGLDGTLDYTLDISTELARHRDGRKILEALGGEVPLGRLAGTVDAPALELPSLLQTAEKALQRAAEGFLQRGLNELLKKKP